MANYPQILPLVPPEANQDAIDTANAELNKRWRSQIGKPTGQQGNRLGTTYYEYDNNGVKGWYRPDPTDPSGGRVIYWHPTEGEQPITLGGDEYARQRQKLIDEVSGATENPLTYEQWKTPLNLTYGELLARKRILDRSVGSHPASQSDIETITDGNLAAARLRGLIADYRTATAGGSQDLSKFSQAMQGFQNMTAANSWAKGDPHRQAYLRVLGDLIELNNLGITNVGKFGEAGKGVTDDLVRTLQSALGGGSLLGRTKLGLTTTGISSLVTVANGILNGGFDPAAIATNAPNVLNRVDYDLYHKVASLSDPTAKVNLPEQYREMGRKAAAELESNDMGPDKTVASTTLIDDTSGAPKQGDKGGGEQTTPSTDQTTPQKPAATPSPQAKVYPRLPPAVSESEAEKKPETAPAYTAPPYPAGSPPATTPAPPVPTSSAEEFANVPGAYNIPPAPISRPGGNPAQQQTSGGSELPIVTFGRQIGQWMTSPNRVQTPLAPKENRPAPAPTPNRPAPTPEERRIMEEARSSPGITQNQLPLDTELGAPLGTPNDAPGVARLHYQEHVDALQPGTPFYWRDHPDAYVRV